MVYSLHDPHIWPYPGNSQRAIFGIITQPRESEENKVWGQDITRGNGRKCGPTSYACSNSGENFAESSLIYELNWLSRHGEGWHSKAAQWILNGYTDASGGGPAVTDMSKWGDDAARVNRLRSLFGQ
jgi:hypothetical protein